MPSGDCQFWGSSLRMALELKLTEYPWVGKYTQSSIKWQGRINNYKHKQEILTF